MFIIKLSGSLLTTRHDECGFDEPGVFPGTDALPEGGWHPPSDTE